MKEVNYTWLDVEKAVTDIAMDMYTDNWRPDYIVGITRGGLVPAVMLSHLTNIPVYTLSVQLSNGDLEENTESNLWMAEDAYGYDETYKDNYKHRPTAAKNILIIDDINRGGDALEWIMNDWKSSCHPASPIWDNVFHGNVRFAALIASPNSLVETDYSSYELLDDDDDIWVNMPWER